MRARAVNLSLFHSSFLALSRVRLLAHARFLFFAYSLSSMPSLVLFRSHCLFAIDALVDIMRRSVQAEAENKSL